MSERVDVDAHRDTECGHTTQDPDGHEAPCGRPTIGWRWYQECGHEPMLRRVCHLHENDGGHVVAGLVGELAEARATVERARALRDAIAADAAIVAKFIAADLTAALDGPTAPTEESA